MERHIRWNWEKSPDNEEMVRYHFVVVDDKDREGIMRRITEQLLAINPIEPVREEEGKVKGTEFRYLFESYDTVVAPREISWTKIGRK
ncbi:MAG TPA: hypothetical protein VJ438_01190, partial [Candidatus Nanoarchaeia archaeon]|nr:hypothetical protein [Candidatus Nanoarchaeia archaeon]